MQYPNMVISSLTSSIFNFETLFSTHLKCYRNIGFYMQLGKKSWLNFIRINNFITIIFHSFSVGFSDFYQYSMGPHWQSGILVVHQQKLLACQPRLRADFNPDWLGLQILLRKICGALGNKNLLPVNSQ